MNTNEQDKKGVFRETCDRCTRVMHVGFVPGLMKKSRKVIYVNSNMKHEHVSLPKTKAQLDKMHPDDDDVFATSLLD